MARSARRLRATKDTSASKTTAPVGASWSTKTWVAICGPAPPPLVYKRNYLRRGDELNLDGGDRIGFDVVTEQVFADQAAFRAWIGQLSTLENGRLVREDEDRFLDRSHYFA